jgi:ribosomal protein S18 acetylase RimI-like enzyme
VSATAGVSLRSASADDLEGVAALFLSCWRQSYRGVLPDRVVELYDPVGARDLWQRSFAAQADGREVIVAERPDHAIVGVVTMGGDPDHPRTGHIYSLYVHPEAQGQGIGARLVSAAIDRLESLGFSEASLWVFAVNVRGRAFYERLGWRPDGTSRVEPEYGEREVRLIRSLAGEGSPGEPSATR